MVTACDSSLATWGSLQAAQGESWVMAEMPFLLQRGSWCIVKKGQGLPSGQFIRLRLPGESLQLKRGYR